MRTLGGILLFLAVFLATGVGMHSALYQRPGIFIWTYAANPETGKMGFSRTVLEVAKTVETAPAAEVGPGEDRRESAPAEKVSPAAAPAETPAAAAKGKPEAELRLFDGKELGKWVKTPFGGEGDVFVNEEGALEFGFGAVITGVHWGGEAPATSNYEISLEAMKLDGTDFFLALTFPVKDSHCTFVVGGWGGGVVGISSVDDLDAAENETMRIEGFETKAWYRIRVRVTDHKLEAWINDENKVDLDLEGRKLSIRPGDLERSIPIGIAAFQTRAQYRNIVWRNLDLAKQASE